ncbi:hypothetical protein SVIO_040090 [Streptomyces violaceusniger]|uniref:Uncharacterized protein n=1 Tax=Streptomyces violaceusniger TaxID=68280 RepID=A0A4D4L2E7_STRVO|nr:hypothetical protein SVIO_040090 [Streptomyces violaceusniger]
MPQMSKLRLFRVPAGFQYGVHEEQGVRLSLGSRAGDSLRGLLRRSAKSFAGQTTLRAPGFPSTEGAGPTIDRPAARMVRQASDNEADRIRIHQAKREPSVFSFKPLRRRTARTAAVGALAAAACVTVMAGSAGAIVNGSDSTEMYPFMATIPSRPRNRV